MSVIIKTFLLVSIMFLPYLQRNQEPFYIESWKTGTRRVHEQKICVRLNKANPEYETQIKDTSGAVRYKLRLWPGRGNENDSSIVEWMVELIDITQGSEANLLRPSNDEKQDYFSAKDRIGWLYPVKNPKSIGVESDVVPIFAKRIIKIENFHLIVEVKDFHFSPNKEGLDSITVQIEFTNAQKEILMRTAPSSMFN